MNIDNDDYTNHNDDDEDIFSPEPLEPEGGVGTFIAAGGYVIYVFGAVTFCLPLAAAGAIVCLVGLFRGDDEEEKR